MEALDLFANEEAMNAPFGKFEVVDQSKNIIKVIGVGGGGSNAVKNMVQKGFKNVTFAVVNTDSQALQKATIPTKIQIGKSGLGVGGVPEKGRDAAEESIEAIKRLFDDNTKMVFIAAGMGGGTGTGASPVIARVARELGILTVGIVTLPFGFEKRHRIDQALKGAKELKENVDSLLVINNERLMEIFDDEMTTIEDAFFKADDVITTATRSIAEIITEEGKINRDFCDVQTVLRNGGAAIMTSGRANGEHRIIKAVQNALNSPLLNKADVQNSKKILYIIYTSHESQIKITELNEVNKFMDKMAPDLEVLWGLYWDESLGEDVRVDIVTTGFDVQRNDKESMEDENKKAIASLYNHYYAADSTVPSIGDALEADMNPNVINMPVNSTNSARVADDAATNNDVTTYNDAANNVESGCNEVAIRDTKTESSDSSENVVSLTGLSAENNDENEIGVFAAFNNADIIKDEIEIGNTVKIDNIKEMPAETAGTCMNEIVNAKVNSERKGTLLSWIDTLAKKMENFVGEQQ